MNRDFKNDFFFIDAVEVLLGMPRVFICRNDKFKFKKIKVNSNDSYSLYNFRTEKKLM